MEIYVANDAGEYHQIDVTDAQLTRYRDFDKGDALTFKTSWSSPVKPLNFVRVEESGGVLFRGAVMTRTGSFGLVTDANGRVKAEGKATWKCESITDLMTRRMSWPMRWGAPNIGEDYVALSIKQAIGSDPPSQSSGVDQYVPPAIWMAQSYFPITPASQTDGVRYYPGWGTSSRAGSRNVYMGGHLCSVVGSLGAITDDYYQIYRDSNNLYVYGYGVGDFGPVCIDGFADYGLRWGNVDRENDYLLSAVDIEVENYWTFVEKFLLEMGIYVTLRHTENYTYLDGSINPPGRGSAEGGAFTIHPGDWSSLKRTSPRDVPPSSLVVQGTGEGIAQVRASRCDPNRRGAWVEQYEEITEGRLEPKGTMGAQADIMWGELSEGDYLSMETGLGYFRPGDWLDVEISPGDVATAQISEISRDLSPIRSIRLGGKYAGPEYAYLEARASEAVEQLRKGQNYGEQVDSGNLGPSTPLEISWTPAVSNHPDLAEITVDLAATTPGDCTEPGLSVTYTLYITNTNYTNKQIAVIPHQTWGTDPVFEGVDISEWCAKDGTQETLKIEVSDPTGSLTNNLGYTVTINGIGRYGQTAIKTLTMEDLITSTLTGTYYLKVNNYGHSGTTTSGSGSALFNLGDVAAPPYDYKAVLCYYAKKIDGLFGGTGVIKNAYVRGFIKTHGVIYYGPQRLLTTGYQLFEDEWIVNPYTGAVWTQSELDDIQAGIYMYLQVNCYWDASDSYIYMSTLRVELR